VVYSCILGSSVQLLLFSVLGALIKTKNDDIMTYVNQIKWNLMPVSEQKLVLFLLGNSQQPLGLTIFGIYPLDMETFVQVSWTVM
jgi:7tm Odorant receptor